MKRIIILAVAAVISVFVTSCSQKANPIMLPDEDVIDSIDIPDADEYIQIDINSGDVVSTLFVYGEGENYYIEQPYQGIYQSDLSFYEMLKAAADFTVQAQLTQNETVAVNSVQSEKQPVTDNAVSGYSDEELAEMAKAYCQQKEGQEPQYAEVGTISDTYNYVTIWLYDTVSESQGGAHGASRNYYTVNRRTAQGVDAHLVPVDLTDALAGRKPVAPDYYSVAADLPGEEVEQFAKSVKQHLLNRDWKALSEDMRYPITIDEKTYNSPEEFLSADLNSSLNSMFFVELEEEDCREMFCNWQGVMMGKKGCVWLNADSGSMKVSGINGLTESFGLPGEIGLELAKDSITPTSVTLRLINDTELTAVFDDSYRLCKPEGDQWTDLELPDGAAFDDIAYMPKRGRPVEWTADWSNLYGSLDSGTYGIVKSVRVENYGIENSECMMMFTIGGGGI